MTKFTHITELINFCEKYKTHKNFSNSAIYGGIETFDIKAKSKIDIEKFFWSLFLRCGSLNAAL